MNAASRTRPALGKAAALALVLAASCVKVEPDRGGLMLLLSEDGDFGLDRLDLQVTAGDQVLLESSYRLPNEATLPTTVAIVSNNDPTATATIHVVGWKGKSPVDVRDNIVKQVPADRVTALRIVLSARCTDQVAVVGGEATSKCGAGSGDQTCDPTRGDCAPAEVNASQLEVYQPGEENSPAGCDATAKCSCVGLAKACGPAGNADCCASNLVPGGTFNRDNDATYPATVANFRLDNYEITVGRFRKFVAAYSQTMIAAGAGKNPNNPSDTGWDPAWNTNLPETPRALTTALKCDPTYQTWTDTAGTAATESLPMDCIDWFEAEAFCIWDGGRLPTEAEWNYAAAGGTAQRKYPWGDAAPDCSYANFQDTDYCVSPGAGAANRVGSESTKGDGLYGQSDLAGNVWEWVQDWYAPYANPCDNCADVKESSERVMRGGGFQFNASFLLSSNRGRFSPPNHNAVGARCARNAP